jgi:hypothetical protein
MTQKIVALGFAVALMALPQVAKAATIGADQLLGVIVPGTPANEANDAIMVNGLLNGWGLVLGYNDGAATGSVLGNNPADPQNETYTLRFSSTTALPAAGYAPAATMPGYRTNTSNPTFNLGGFSYDWLVAKWGPNAAVYYIGNLAPGTEITLTLEGTGLPVRGLSNYTLFNRVAAPVPEGGTTLILLGFALAGLGVARRKLSA